MKWNQIKVPERCLCCGAEWNGGAQVPGRPMKKNYRTFYECGSKVWIEETSKYNTTLIISKCPKQEEK